MIGSCLPSSATGAYQRSPLVQGKERSSGFGKPAHSFGAPFKSTCPDFGKSTSRTESLTDLWQSSRAHLSSQAHAGTDMWKRKLQSTGEQRSPLRCTCIAHRPSTTSFPSLPNMFKTYRQNGTMAEIGREGLWAKQPWQLGPSRGPVESVYWQCTSRT